MVENERARRIMASVTTIRRRDARRTRAKCLHRALARGVVLVLARALVASSVCRAEGIWGLDTVYDGVGYDPDHPDDPCGPSKDGNSFRSIGCLPRIRATDTYGNVGDPAFSFARYAYTGRSFGPPYINPEDTAGCTYSLTYEAAVAANLEHCFFAPTTGGVPTTQAQKEVTAAYSTHGWRLPVGEWKDKLPDYVVKRYDLPPLRLGFEEGTFWPNWKLVSSGLPNFAIVKKCFLEAHSGDYQLCSAYPTDRREDVHGVLRVQSISFALGRGSLIFNANGGTKDIPDIPEDPYDVSSHGKGILGVALTRISDGYRVLTKPVRARRFWETLQWEEALLEQYYGEVFQLEIYDYTSGPFGWIAVDSFIIPQARVKITEVTPSIGPRSGGTRITITGENFGSSADDKTVFIGDEECTDLRMTSSRCTTETDTCTGGLTCTTPPGSGVGLTVSVIIGDPDVVRVADAVARGPTGGFQAGFCGDESTEHPFSDCKIDAVSAVAGARKRGFTYADQPTVTSTPVTTAVQDRQYKYTITVEDPDEGDNDNLEITAIKLPQFLAFDPTTRLLTGTPLRSDVKCRSNKWHPAAERCAEGASYDVEFEITDGSTLPIRHDFTIDVTTEETALLVDKSFHWDNAFQIFKKYEQVTNLGSVSKVSEAMRDRNVSNPTEIEGFHYRNPLNADDEELRNDLIEIASQPDIDEVKVDAAIQYLEDNGLADVNLDMIQALKEQVALQKQQDATSGAFAPTLQGVSDRGWSMYFKKLGSSLFAGSSVHTSIAGLNVPDSASHMLSREKIIVIKLYTPCNSTALNTDRFIAACDLIGISQEHEIWLGFGEYGATLEDVIVSPRDFEYTDLVVSAIYTQDIPGFLEQVTRRIVSQSARLQEIAELSSSYPLWFDQATAMLTVNITITKTQAVYPVSVVMHLSQSYPYPEPGKYGLPEIHVISCERIDYDYDDTLAILTREMTRAGGSLTSRVNELQDSVSEFASKCPNSCNNKGDCESTETLPPRCQCEPPYTGADCSKVDCPTGETVVGGVVVNKTCSGNGACDSDQVCVHDPESGETDCAGGTGKCACIYPYFGTNCALQACKKNYIVFEGNSSHKLDISAGTAPIRAKYEAMGLQVYDVKISETNGDQPEAWAIEGDELSQAHLVGSAYVEFESSEDGEKARAQEPFYTETIPSRGDAIQAQYFAQEYRDQTTREQQLLALFGKTRVECNAAGACNFNTGDCYCASKYYGQGCEFQYCPNNCAGHGRCDKLTGTCECEDFYTSDETSGCKLVDFGFVSTTCMDQAIDTQVDDSGARLRPLHASCLFGTSLGNTIDVEADTTTNFVTDIQGNVCLDCSGYTGKFKQINFYGEEPCLSGSSASCDATKQSYDHITRGIGMIPGETESSQTTFDLTAMRAANLQFSTFRTRAGIVRKSFSDRDQGGCGLCDADNPQCGAIFTITIDGVQVWSSLVNSRYEDTLEFDISAASTLTLSTEKYTAPYWRSNTNPGNDGQDQPAEWCDGAAWAESKFW